MTRLAFQSLMLPTQWELCISVVVELAFRPSIGLMTGCAIGTVAALMDIIICMTVATIFLLLLLVERPFMTSDTLYFPMTSMQSETGIPVMVEFGFVPTIGDMAFFAFGTEPAAVRVI